MPPLKMKRTQITNLLDEPEAHIQIKLNALQF